MVEDHPMYLEILEQRAADYVRQPGSLEFVEPIVDDPHVAVEREFGRLKHEWAMLPLRVRGRDRVRLHADLTILAKLGCALAMARATALA